MNRAEALKKLRSFAGALKARGATSLYLFGSTARNKAGGNSDLDLFIDEDIEYAQRLQQAGVPTELHVYPGGSHAFESYAPGSALARRFVRDRDEALGRAFRV